MKKSHNTLMLCALLFGTTTFVAACGDNRTDDGCTDGQQRCENNVIEECTAEEWTAATDCTATLQWCALDDQNVASCGSETALCEDAGVEEWICFQDYTVTCNTTTGEGDVFRTDCTDASEDPSLPGECFNYGGDWGAECLMPEGAPCFDPNVGIFLGCGDGGAVDLSLGCDQLIGCISLTEGACSDRVRICDGETLVLCQEPLGATPINIAYKCDDSSNGGGTCQPDGAGASVAACVHGTTGGLCIPGFVECSGGLNCNAGSGVCE